MDTDCSPVIALVSKKDLEAGVEWVHTGAIVLEYLSAEFKNRTGSAIHCAATMLKILIIGIIL